MAPEKIKKVVSKRKPALTEEERIPKTTLGKFLRDFLNYLEIERGRSIQTRQNYLHYLVRFLEQTKASKPGDITDAVVREFRLWLNRQLSGLDKAKKDTLSKKTQNYHLIALRAFLKFLAREGVTSLAPERIDLAKTGERLLDLITEGELTRLLSAPSGSDLKAVRDKAILELLFSTGLRVSELCSLTSNIDLTSDELSIRGKGGKVRVVFLSDTAKSCLKAYLGARKDMNDALFVQVGREITNPIEKKEANPLTKRTIERIIKQYAIKVGISKKVTPHTMRHLFATDLLSNGADIRSVQALLGHSSIITTQIYTHVTDKHLRDIHKKFHGKR